MIAKDREISEIENRRLQQLPTFSIDSFLSGSYAQKFEEYLTDQFVMKMRWVGLKSDVERLLQRGENNGIYFAKDGYLLEVFNQEGTYFKKNLESLNAFFEKMPNLSMTTILVPTAVKLYEDKLPLFAPTFDQLKMLEVAKNQLEMDFIDVFPLLNEHKEEYIYYKTDHHWTTLGAYYVYQQLMDHWEMTPYLDYEVQEVATNFYGTSYFKANNYHLEPDKIFIYTPRDDVQFTVTWEDQTESVQGLYNMDYLNQKDKYSMFINGNHALTIVKSSIANGKKLMIFKDSYAHCLTPFLAMNFEEIHLIDSRYFNLNPYDYIREHQFDQVLFLYNLSMFSTDSTMLKLKSFQ
ncbi:MAG: hypothetical protein K2G70_06820 [Turicibacter sp.]|nr:hypothetical protein [Turicibacter sp.]